VDHTNHAREALNSKAYGKSCRMYAMQVFQKNWLTYTILLAVLAVSFVGVYVLPISEVFKGFVAMPGAGALLGFLAQLWREYTEHERAIELQNRQQDFALGTASHMAEVAYDKHVAFCEEYMVRVQSGFQELLKEGATQNALNIGGDLVRIRFKHATWLTSKLEEELKPYEMGLIIMGAKMSELKLSELPVGEQRTKLVEEIYKIFGLIMGHGKPENESESLIHMQKPIENIRKILGIDALMALRQGASDIAVKRLKGVEHEK